MSIFAGIGLLLAAIGIYGVVSYGPDLRIRAAGGVDARAAGHAGGPDGGVEGRVIVREKRPASHDPGRVNSG